MVSSFDRYRKDVSSLVERGNHLVYALHRETSPSAFKKEALRALGSEEEVNKLIADLPIFKSGYQPWYSEAKALVRQLLPERLDDFARLYEKPKTRKEITYENYTIEDAVHGLRVTRNNGAQVIVSMSAAIPRLEQQVAIVTGIENRFESTLFDIKQLLQGDIFDSELDAARHLLKNAFTRAAGALAGVVLEKHLGEVASAHNVTARKKEPSIADLNDALKAADVVEVSQWRFIQHLGDIRNLCDHNKSKEPSKEQVADLLDGVSKVIKTVF